MKKKKGKKVLTYDLTYHLHQVSDYVQWGYLFHAWGLPFACGQLARVHGCEACRAAWVNAQPADLREQARQAIKLYSDARQLLARMDFVVRTHARIALLPANGDGEDIVVWDDDGEEHRLPLLRQQHGSECKCLADYLRPLSQGVRDRIGLFVSTVDASLETSFPDDPYRHMLCQTLADRLAEATIECAHQQVRTRLWGYSPDEHLTTEQLFNEEYVGRRPAVGYPSLPDQSLNFLLDSLLHMQSVGVRLTESGAMMPHATTSGLMISHPSLRHFSIGPIGDDQLASYARRRGITAERARQFLAANLLPQ